MSVIIGSARINENGKTTNGLVGDQKQTSTPDYTGEVSLQSFYIHKLGWVVLRPRKATLGESIARKMLAACNNKNLGYDQGSTRTGVVVYGTSSVKQTGCDCGSLVRACVKEASGIDPGNFNTETEVEALRKTGLFNDPVPYVNGMLLKAGDVLVTATKGHTAIVIGEEKGITMNTSKIQNDFSKAIWEVLKAKKLFNDYAIAGIIGNLYAESGLKPNNLQNTSEKKLGLTDDEYTVNIDVGIYSEDQFINDKAGYGLAQWTSSGRKQGLYEFINPTVNRSIGDGTLQVDYLVKEITMNKSLMNKLKNANSVKEASDAVLHDYERPADQSEAVENKRAEYGQTFYDLYADKEEAPVAKEEPKKKNEEFLVKVDTPFLNIRKGPGQDYEKTGLYTGIGVFTIVETKDNWGRLKSDKGWISLDYAKRM